jgi:hypothetical protein
VGFSSLKKDTTRKSVETIEEWEKNSKGKNV